MPYQPAVLGTARLGNFRLGYVPAALVPIRANRVRIVLGDRDITSIVRVGSLRIQDVLNDASNTCALAIAAPIPPAPNQRLSVTLNSDDPITLFAGTLQTVATSYEGRPEQVIYPCTAIDDTALANRRRPFGEWTATSATTIALYLVTHFAPDLSPAGIEADLPNVDVILDGTEGMSGAFQQLAKGVGGYFKFENGVAFLFTALTGDAPDPLDADHPFLNDPPITSSQEVSQLRTRVYGKGHGVELLADVAAGETILPLKDVSMFAEVGGQAIAIAQIIAYTGVHVGEGGSLTGAGASPSAAPAVAIANGTGIESGAHEYAVSFVTAAGESLVGPRASVTVGVVPTPKTAPVPSWPSVGSGLDTGSHDYVTTFLLGGGETLPGPNSPMVTTNAGISNPTAAITFHYGAATGGVLNAGTYQWTYTWFTATGETAPAPVFANYVNAGNSAWPSLPIGPPGTIGRRYYRSAANGATLRLVFQVNENVTTVFSDGTPDSGLSSNVAPSVNTTATAVVPLTAIPLGPAGITGRRLYRRFNLSGSYQAVATIADNTTKTYIDTVPNASLGGAPPSTSATANQVTVSAMPIGPASVTSRRIYRTAANTAVLQLLTTIANNTATVFADAKSDALLGAAAPIADTSGLQVQVGQVLAGATVCPVAGTGAFPPTGWAVIGNGQQVIRYTGLTATSLTGIPATGLGSIVATVSNNSSITAAPSLIGVTGLVKPVPKGTGVNIWVQRDDAGAQAAQASIDAGNRRVRPDGIYEGPIVSDERRGIESLTAMCDAALAQFSRPIQTVRYATRDVKTKSGKAVTVHLVTPPIAAALIIQDVAISEIDIVPGGHAPRFDVTASTTRFSLDHLLRQFTKLLGGQ